MNACVQFCLRLYRALARAYPHEFQMLYGEDLERMGEDAAPEIWRRHGVLGLARLLADIARDGGGDVEKAATGDPKLQEKPSTRKSPVKKASSKKASAGAGSKQRRQG